ncbi:Uncharacterized protein At1g01500 [Linum perenne]
MSSVCPTPFLIILLRIEREAFYHFSAVMDNTCETSNRYRPMENGHAVSPHQRGIKVSSLPWLDLKVFYVRVSKCEIGDSMPEYLIVNHTPLSPDTLLEVNGVGSRVDSNGTSTLLRRDRLDKKSEEATFVSTNSVRTTDSVRFDVYESDILILHGVLELSNVNGYIGEPRNHSKRWSIKCEVDVPAGTSFLKAEQFVGSESPSSPRIEVYIAGSFLGTPIILTKTMHILNGQMIIKRKGILDSIVEHETVGSLEEKGSSSIILESAESLDGKSENEEYEEFYRGMVDMEGEDGELSWFNAGVRVGVGIGLRICVGIGIGVGLLVRAGNLRRMLF